MVEAQDGDVELRGLVGFSLSSSEVGLPVSIEGMAAFDENGVKRNWAGKVSAGPLFAMRDPWKNIEGEVGMKTRVGDNGLVSIAAGRTEVRYPFEGEKRPAYYGRMTALVGNREKAVGMTITQGERKDVGLIGRYGNVSGAIIQGKAGPSRIEIFKVGVKEGKVAAQLSVKNIHVGKKKQISKVELQICREVP